MIQQFVQAWEAMENGNVSLDKQGERYFYNSSEPKVLDCEILANDLLISNGNLNHSNAEELQKLGFKVFPLEKDRFGWLLGGITKSPNTTILTFG